MFPAIADVPTGIPPAMMKLMYKGEHWLLFIFFVTMIFPLFVFLFPVSLSILPNSPPCLTILLYLLSPSLPLSSPLLSGLLKDDKTLRDAKLVSGVKMMVVGSTVDDVLTVQPPNPSELKAKKIEAGETDTLKMKGSGCA